MVDFGVVVEVCVGFLYDLMLVYECGELDVVIVCCEL